MPSKVHCPCKASASIWNIFIFRNFTASTLIQLRTHKIPTKPLTIQKAAPCLAGISASISSRSMNQI